MLINNSDRIGLLRISNIGEDDISLRRSVSSELNNTELTPRGISPSSILIIRDLKDPMPGHFYQCSGNPEWAQKLRAMITDISRKASRPVSGFIPLNSAYVLFADEAELFACLLLDIIKGSAGEHWWWKLFIQDFPILKYEGIKGIVQINPASFPAILFQIYRWGQIHSFFLSLNPVECEYIFHEVCAEYGVSDSEIRRYVLKMKKAEGDEEFQYYDIRDCRNPSDMEGSVNSGLIEYLLKSINDNVLSGIHEKEKISLFALCIIIRYRSSLVGTNLFIHVLHAFVTEILKKNKINDEINIKTKSIKITSTGESERKQRTGLKYLRQESRNTHSVSGKDIGEVSSLIDIGEHKTKSSVNTIEKKIISNFHFQTRDDSDSINIISKKSDDNSRISYRKDGHAEISANHIQSKIHNEKIFRAGDEGIVSGTVRSSGETEEILQVPKETISNDNGIKTNLCGVFYLINLMRELNLPACLEDDFGLSSRLGGWGMLELLSRAILGNEVGFRKDPLWDILAELDGREKGMLPGDRIFSRGYYRMPGIWIEKYRSKNINGFSWGKSEKRLRIWSENFLILECENENMSPVDNVRKELENFAIDTTDICEKSFDTAPVEKLGRELFDLSPAMCELMSYIMPFIRWHLKLAIGKVSKEPNPEKEILICEGEVFITSTHIDIVMKLDDISLPVRLSCLDTDPDWVPDLGRVIKFYFV